MTDIETTVENARAQYHYPPIRTALLPSDVDELQLRLADRLHRHRHQHALEVIADLGRVFDAEEAEPAVEALGRLLVHASLLAGCERMAIAPIIALGRELTRDSQVSSELPLKPAAALAGAVLEWRQEPAAVIVCSLAMAIAKAIDDCEIVHELKVDPLELFKVAAREVLDGSGATLAAVIAPAVQPTQQDKAARRAEAWTELRKATGGLIGMGDEEAAERSAFMDEAAAAGVPKEAFERRCVPDPDGSPLGWSWPACPPGHRPETYDEVRERIKADLRTASDAVVTGDTAGWDPDGGRPINPDVLAAAIMADDPTEATTPEQRANVEHWYKTPHETLRIEPPAYPATIETVLAAFADLFTATGTDLDAAALAIGPPIFARRIVPDPGNPGGQGPFGDNPWPPDHRWETDAELRERIETSMSPASGSPEACSDPK